MSRTYHHGEKAKAARRKREPTRWESMMWLHSTPGYWIHDMMTVQQRAKVRQLSGKVLKLTKDELEDPPLFPLAKKPHVYYW